MLRVIVPMSERIFGVHETVLVDGVSVEQQLIAIGKRLVGKTLSVDFSWRSPDVVNVIAKPIYDSAYGAAALARALFEARAEVAVSEQPTEIYDSAKSVVEVVSLDELDD